MDYIYENLGDERFQEFCSTLIAKEYPNLQAFPVGQPDGGRDSLAYFMDSPQKDFIIFQVKYVRNPKSILEPHKWLTKIIADEAPKIQQLIPKGAKEFYILTNVDGTAHLGSGSKDKVNDILENNISIPAQCWWRDDISRRFEKDPMFKWSYPEILNGQDILNSLIFFNSNENNENREAIINAYLTDQYRIDNEVKFKQIDLQNKLIDLYTDVPLRIKKFNRKDRKLFKILESIENSNIIISNEDFNIHGLFHREEGVGAAKFLLSQNVQNGIERILLEGGPGQGKSTISQYICQVHRAKLLNKREDLKLLPEHICRCPVRIPFKIDLRHIASWIEKKNPYDAQLSEDVFNHIWSKTLESFMIGHISYHSPNSNFTISDLITIIKKKPILIVFDGFDEIADINIRHEVIDFIEKGIERFKANTNFIQVLITSRPAAFSNANGFPVDKYPHFELTDITNSCTKEYVEKWVKANKLENREGNEIKRLVEEKLQVSHLKELAKSPMQLAIFISLLRTRGESLPNKRTALYDSYIDLFFNRESEKNQIIRENRDLIIDIHKYLAWILHSEAELYNNNGTITFNTLVDKIKKYLVKEGYETEIADKLFQAVQERVCALVSRVQGTYEFEVQPLREYFCARYLYQTAPYSPVGKEKSGTKPERFSAIARDFYWNNVVRFYAGCFDKGELPMLVDELKELQNDDLLQYTNYPRLLTSQLLSDWVFTQYPKYLKDVVKIILDGINITGIINQNSRFYGGDEPIMLPNECGRVEIIKECFEQLKHFPDKDYANELIGLIVNNSHEIVLELWLKELDNIGFEKKLQWLEYAYRMQIIHKIDKDILSNIILQDADLNSQEQKIQIIINGNRMDIINANLNIKKIALNGILSGNISIMPQRKSQTSSLQYLSTILHPYIISNIIYENRIINDSFSFYINRFGGSNTFREDNENTLFGVNSSNDYIDEVITNINRKLSNTLNVNIEEWQTSLENWDTLIEEIRGEFGDRWALNVSAIIISGIKGSKTFDKEYCSLRDSSISLCKRVNYARTKSGDIGYWEQQLIVSNNLMFAYLVFLTWATPKVIITLSSKIQKDLADFSKDDIRSLSNYLKKTTRHSTIRNAQAKVLIESSEFKSLPFDIKYLISFRFPNEVQSNLICSQKNNISSFFKLEIIQEKFQSLIFEYLKMPNKLESLREIKEYYKLYSNSKIDIEYISHHYFRFQNGNNIKIPIDIAKKIMKDSKSYPRIIASIAEKACRLYANKNVKAVGRIAKDKKWFD